MSDLTSTVAVEAQPTEEGRIQLRHSDESDVTPNAQLPPPPIPSSDPGLIVSANEAGRAEPHDDENDLSKLAPTEALRMFSAGVELLVRMTGDVPPTPPPKSPALPQMSGMQAEKENMRSNSEKNLARMRQLAELEARKVAEAAAAAVAARSPPEATTNSGMNKLQAYNAAMSAQTKMQGDSEAVDGVRLRHPAAPVSPPAEPAPYIVVGADSQPLNLQHGAITRKFYSKNEPPITVNQYLMRLHQFCPMSTAVYLAASLYIHRLAVEERAIPVTRRNAHRLVLAALRVAMKALEDLSYPHGKISKVGGVSETELARLEISFCFLAGFELVVDEQRLQAHCAVLSANRAESALRSMEMPTLKLPRKTRQVALAGA